MEYISSNPDSLFKAQLELPYDKQTEYGGSKPDFVVLNFKNKCVYVVEVTTAVNVNPIAEKVTDRKKRWYKAIESYNAGWVALTLGWDYKTCIFVREQAVETLAQKFISDTDVAVKSLDSVLTPWNWKWESNHTPSNPLE